MSKKATKSSPVSSTSAVVSPAVPAVYAGLVSLISQVGRTSERASALRASVKSRLVALFPSGREAASAALSEFVPAALLSKCLSWAFPSPKRAIEPPKGFGKIEASLRKLWESFPVGDQRKQARADLLSLCAKALRSE